MWLGWEKVTSSTFVCNATAGKFLDDEMNNV
jgi:hypothetical protein